MALEHEAILKVKVETILIILILKMNQKITNQKKVMEKNTIPKVVVKAIVVIDARVRTEIKASVLGIEVKIVLITDPEVIVAEEVKIDPQAAAKIVQRRNQEVKARSGRLVLGAAVAQTVVIEIVHVVVIRQAKVVTEAILVVIAVGVPVSVPMREKLISIGVIVIVIIAMLRMVTHSVKYTWVV